MRAGERRFSEDRTSRAAGRAESRRTAGSTLRNGRRRPTRCCCCATLVWPPPTRRRSGHACFCSTKDCNRTGESTTARRRSPVRPARPASPEWFSRSSLTSSWRTPRVDAIAAHLLEAQMPDGGWNCRRLRGATHASVHTTISVLKGLRNYERRDCDVSAVRAAQRRGRSCLTISISSPVPGPMSAREDRRQRSASALQSCNKRGTAPARTLHLSLTGRRAPASPRPFGDAASA
jgi:hypothetical protein